VARVGERRGTNRVLVGKHERNKSLGRPICIWKGDITMQLKEIGWEGVE